MARGLRLGITRKRKRSINYHDDGDEANDDGEQKQQQQQQLNTKRSHKKIRSDNKDDDVDFLNKKNVSGRKRRRTTTSDFGLSKCSSARRKEQQLEGSSKRRKINNNNSSNNKRKFPRLKIGDRVNLSDILFTKDRDFLITYNDRNCPVQAKHLEGKVVVLHFVPLVPWNSHLMLYVTSLVDTYNALHPNGGFEVVFVGVKIGKFPSNPQTLLNPSLENCFEEKFSIMPWTAIPFSDITSQKSLERRLRFSFSRFVYDVYTVSVVVDPTGLVLQCQADDFFLWYGARAYPFTLKRVERLMFEDEETSKHPSITTLLTSLGRDYLINKDNQNVPVRDLEEKVVALYFYEDFPKDDLTKKIQSAYEQLADKSKFEVILVYVHDAFDSCEFASEEAFWKKFNKMPCLALPFKDPRCKYLKRIFNYPMDLEGPGPDPRLVIIGPQGQFVEPYGVDILKKFGISAYPFSRKRAAELESESDYIKTLKLDMLLDPRTSFTQEDGSKVKLSQLMGKRIIFLIENGWATRYPAYWRRLKSRYLKMKNTDDEFEVIHAPYEYVASSYGESLGTVPWLRHRTFRLKSNKCTLLHSVFRGGVGLVAFDHDGRIVRRTSYPTIEKGNKKFPFYTGGLVEEALKDLVKQFDWDHWLDVKPLPDIFAKALLTAFQRYNAYLDAFQPDETFIRKKVENELGTRMIHLKMRCGGLGSEWGKITVLGTSGLSGSYVEHRA